MTDVVQLCPKCLGQGIVSRPPWLPADIPTWAGMVGPYACNLCDGKKVVDVPRPQPIVVNLNCDMEPCIVERAERAFRRFLFRWSPR